MKGPSETTDFFSPPPPHTGVDLGGEFRWIWSCELLDRDGWILASCPLWLHRVQVRPTLCLV